MRHGFQNKLPLSTRSFDGRNVIVGEHLHYIAKDGNEYRTETFLRSDGGSIPNLGFIGGVVMLAGWLLAGWHPWPGGALVLAGFIACTAALRLKSYGRWWWSYVFHDGLFQNRVEKLVGLNWTKWNPTETKSNALLFEAMESQKADYWEAVMVWINLNWFGWRAFKSDRQRPK